MSSRKIYSRDVRLPTVARGHNLVACHGCNGSTSRCTTRIEATRRGPRTSRHLVSRETEGDPLLDIPTATLAKVAVGSETVRTIRTTAGTAVGRTTNVVLQAEPTATIATCYRTCRSVALGGAGSAVVVVEERFAWIADTVAACPCYERRTTLVLKTSQVARAVHIINTSTDGTPDRERESASLQTHRPFAACQAVRITCTDALIQVEIAGCSGTVSDTVRIASASDTSAGIRVTETPLPRFEIEAAHATRINYAVGQVVRVGRAVSVVVHAITTGALDKGIVSSTSHASRSQTFCCQSSASCSAVDAFHAFEFPDLLERINLRGNHCIKNAPKTALVLLDTQC